MREAVSEVTDSTVGNTPGMGKVWAIGERPVALTDSPEIARIRTLLATSRTPSQADTNSRSRGSNGYSTTALAVSSKARRKGGAESAGVVHRAMQWKKSHLYSARPVTPGPPQVASPGGSGGFPGGLTSRDVGRVVPLPELGMQPYSDMREFMCLTSAGLQVFAKLRPVDVLYELLAQNHAQKVG